jgi:hypothetical protein
MLLVVRTTGWGVVGMAILAGLVGPVAFTLRAQVHRSIGQ